MPRSATHELHRLLLLPLAPQFLYFSIFFSRITEPRSEQKKKERKTGTPKFIFPRKLEKVSFVAAAFTKLFLFSSYFFPRFLGYAHLFSVSLLFFILASVCFRFGTYSFRSEATRDEQSRFSQLLNRARDARNNILQEENE